MALVRTFQQRLLILVVSACALTVFFVTGTILTRGYFRLRKQLVENLEVQAQVISMTATATLQFQDKDSAKETLRVLDAVPDAVAAVLYDQDGNEFARWTRSGTDQDLDLSLRPAGRVQQQHWMVLTQPLQHAGDHVGWLEMAFDLDPIYARLTSSLLVSMASALAAAVVALLLGLRLQRIVARPIGELAGAAMRVSRTQDYAVRARKYTDDEFGQLTDAFNQMLEQIQRQSAEIEEGQKRFRLAVGAAANAMVMVDQTGRILLVNAQTEKLFGYTREELVGQPVEMLVPERFRGEHPGFRATFFRDPKARPMGTGRDLFGRHKDGTEIPVEIGLNPIETDEGLRVLSSIVDITARRMQQQALRASQERLALAQAAGHVGTFDWDVNTNFVHWTSELETLFGLEPGTFSGSFDDWAQRVHPEDREATVNSLRASVEHCRELRQEYRIIRPDGTVRWIMANGQTICDDEGKPTRMIGVNVDITERKAAEQERAELLESERAARSEAERASRMKDEFVATLSHELRTPLTAILGWAQMLRRGPEPSEQMKQGLEIIERNARVQTRIIEDLLDISRIVSGKIRLDVQQVDLAQVIDAALATVKPAAEARGIRLQTVLDPHVGPVRGDPNRLQQVIWNLLSNAIKFTERGGRVQIALARVNSHVEISVSDTGQGIHPDFLPFVFQRFRQADSSTKRSHGGLGLGLAIVRQLIELHGGTVRAASEGEGRGSTFIIELPLSPLSAEEESEPRLHPRTPKAMEIEHDQMTLHGLRVLVVDDEPDARDLITRLLVDCGAAVESASSAEEAIREILTFKPHVMVSDIGMPGCDGYDLIRKVRSLPSESGGAVAAVALTAFARSEDRTRALMAGYQMHISKPVEPSELTASVASLARRSWQNPTETLS